MTFEDFSFGFPHIAHFPLDHIGSKGGDYYFKKTGHFKSAAFERAVKNAKMKGKDYNDAVRNWLGDKERQKKLGFRFEYKKKRS